MGRKGNDVVHGYRKTKLRHMWAAGRNDVVHGRLPSPARVRVRQTHTVKYLVNQIDLVFKPGLGC